MKALILASGMGVRIRPHTDDKPKNMVDLGGETLLRHQLGNLKNAGINDVLITTGPFEDKMKAYARSHFPEMNIEFVNNPRFDSTNYIYSLWLARGKVDDDVLYIHGDLFFDWRLLKLLMDAPGSAVLVNGSIEAPKKDFKGIIENGRVRTISVNIHDEKAPFVAPLYKLKKRDFDLWLDRIDAFIRKGDVRSRAEVALNQVSHKMNLIPKYYTDEVCAEIDTLEDLELVKRVVRSNY